MESKPTATNKTLSFPTANAPIGREMLSAVECALTCGCCRNWYQNEKEMVNSVCLEMMTAKLCSRELSIYEVTQRLLLQRG